MMKKQLLSLIIILFIAFSFCSAQETTFSRIYPVNGVNYIGKFIPSLNGGYFHVSEEQDTGLAPVYFSIMKINSSYQPEWRKRYNTDMVKPSLTDLVELPSGNLVGVFTYNHDINTDSLCFVLAGFDKLGNVQWVKPYFPGVYSIVKGLSINHSNGNLLLSLSESYSYENNPLKTYSDKIGMIEFDTNGNPIRTYAASKSTGNGYLSSTRQTNDGGFLITGTDDYGNKNSFIAKLAGNGSYLWSFTDYNTYSTYNYGVAETPGHCFLWSFGLAGVYPEFHTYLAKISSSGNWLWTKEYNGLIGDTVALVNAYNIPGGQMMLTLRHGIKGTLVAEIDSNGTVSACKIFNQSSLFVINEAINSDDKGNLLLKIRNGASFYSGDGSDGLLLTSWSLEGECNGNNYSLTNKTVDFKFSNHGFVRDTLLLWSGVPVSLTPASESVGNSLLCSTTATEKPVNIDSQLKVFPNPSDGNLTITFPFIIYKGSIEIYSALGERIYNEPINSSIGKEINLKKISHGVYLAKVLNGEKQYLTKLIVE